MPSVVLSLAAAIPAFAGEERGLWFGDVYGYMYALGELEPGDEVEVVVLRGGKRLVFEVVLERGGRQGGGGCRSGYGSRSGSWALRYGFRVRTRTR